MRSRDIRADGDLRPGPDGGFDGRRLPAGPGRFAAAVLGAVLLAVPWTPAAGTPIGPAPAAADAVPRDSCCEDSRSHRGFPAVAASSLDGGPLSKLRVRHDVLRAVVGGRRLELVADNPFYRLGDEVRQLVNPAYVRDGRLWLPTELARRLGPSAADGEPAAAPAERDPWKVVIDPGHGGRDPGARGPRGTVEKEVVLEISRKVKEELEARDDIEVTLTRTDDRFLPLTERSRMAVRQDADLFVSVHANAAPSRSAEGFETYFLGEARTEEARRVAMRENASVRYEQGGSRQTPEDLQVILANLDLRGYQRESGYVAGQMQNALRTEISASDRGVKRNVFLVLVNASGAMPAVLVETGFLSNPEGERRLSNPEGQDAIARGLARAVARYFEERANRESVRTVSRG